MAGRQVDVQSERVLGRKGDVIVEDSEVSRRHAVLRPIDRGFEIEDLGSHNGTMVDEAWIKGPVPLHDGSVVRVGQTTILVHLRPAERPVSGPNLERMVPAAEEATGRLEPAQTDQPPPRPDLAVVPGPLSGSDLIQTSLGQYELDRIIRRDDMFAIYRGYQASLDRYVAVKVLLSPRDQEFVERFKLEARILARLQHPNIVPLYEQGEYKGHLYLVMQYLDNEVTLAELVGEPIEPIRALRLMAQVLSALDYAHGMKVIHRNVKPSNVMMPLPTWPMLAGFDIAKLVSEGDQPGLTRHGLILGTAAYIAPEQAFGLPVDGRTDVYSAGVVLYELLTGRVPFQADSPQDMLSKQAYVVPPRPRSLQPDIPLPVEPPLMRALEKEPSRRYQTAAAMSQALESVAAWLEHSDRSDPASDLYSEGVDAFDRGQWGLAVDRLSRLAELDPGNDDVLSLLQAAQQAGSTDSDLTQR